MTEEVIYNYRSVNRAIDLEVDKYRAENWSRYSRICLLYTSPSPRDS